jgi:hypothetical protein
MPKAKQSWVGSQHPPTQWNMRGGRWSSVECSTSKQKSNKSPCWFVVQTIVAVYFGKLHFWNRLLWIVQTVAIEGAKLFQSWCNMLRLLWCNALHLQIYVDSGSGSAVEGKDLPGARIPVTWFQLRNRTPPCSPYPAPPFPPPAH